MPLSNSMLPFLTLVKVKGEGTTTKWSTGLNLTHIGSSQFTDYPQVVSSSSLQSGLTWYIAESSHQTPHHCNGARVAVSQFSHSVVSDPMDCSMPGFPVQHQLPELTQTHVHQDGDAIQPSHPLSCLHLLPSIFPSIRSFLMSQLFASGGQSIGASASTSVRPKNIQGWFP